MSPHVVRACALVLGFVTAAALALILTCFSLAALCGLILRFLRWREKRAETHSTPGQ